jgi:2-hydroxycyclohexanecarboxyl-CoA dehydrogenase
MKNRVALVTGSTRGIGNAIARRLAAEGARVIVHGRDEAAVAVAVHDIRGSIGVCGDISDGAAVRAMCSRAKDQLGSIDIVVNNAGTSTMGSFLDSTDEDWDRLIAVNLIGPRNVLREVLPDMQCRGWGRILNVTSDAGVRGTPGFAAYSASKGALLALSLALAQELLGSGIHVNTLAPLAPTDLVRSQLPASVLEKLIARGMPTVDDCSEIALQLVADVAPTGHLVIMHFGDEPIEVRSSL